MIKIARTLLNGVDVDQLNETINAVKDNADVALFKFKSTTNWIKGGHCQTKINNFYGALEEDYSRTKPFILEGDEPKVLLGEDHGPNAVEAVLHALASCLSVGIVYNASAMGIKVNSLKFELEGEIDLHAFLGISEEKRPGYKNIIVTVNADTSASEEHFIELLEYVKKTSPVFDIISKPVPIKIVIA